MNLYEIDAEILNCVDVETGEIFDVDRFEELNLTREAKIENICLWIKNLKAEAAALKAEKEVFDNRKKAVENKMESLRKYISGYLQGTSFESTKVKVSFRKSKSLEISEGAIIPSEYLLYVEPCVDKIGLKKAIVSGLKIDGVTIEENYNMIIR